MDGAAHYYKSALTIAPNDADALMGRSRVYSEKNDPGHRRCRCWSRWSKGGSDKCAGALIGLSAVYRKLNRPEDAKARAWRAYQKYKDMKEKTRKDL